jgi:chromosome segregation ATPase
MNRMYILTASILALTPRIFFAPDGPAVAGGASPKPLSLEERLSKATDELTKANGDLKTASDSLAAMTKERDDAKSELAKVKGQFDELGKTADTLKLDLKTANDACEKMKGERDSAQKDLTKANEDRSRLEKLCDVKGVDPKAAVPSAPEPAAKSTVAEWDAKMKAAKSPEARAQICAEFEKAVAEKRIAG